MTPTPGYKHKKLYILPTYAKVKLITVVIVKLEVEHYKVDSLDVVRVGVLLAPY